MYLITYFIVVVICVILTSDCAVTAKAVNQDVFLKVIACFDPSTTSKTSQKLKSDKECALLCLQTEGCRSYSVDKLTQMCYLNENLLKDTGCVNGFTHRNSKKIIDAQCLNGGEFSLTSHTCRCFNSYVGNICEQLMQDCSHGFESGQYDGMEGVFIIHPPTSPSPIRVRCVMKWKGRTVILQRDRDKTYVNFTRAWDDYKIGIGNVEDDGNHYIGNNAIHFITANRKQRMMIEAVFDGGSFQQYTHTGVQVAGESDNYRLTYKSEWGHKDYPLGDCFLRDGIPFSTIDRDNDAHLGSCALTHMSGWWFDACGPCNPTGELQASYETHKSSDPTSLYVKSSSNAAVRKLNVFLFF